MQTVTIELSPDLHRQLAELAAAADRPLEDYTQDLLIALLEQPPVTARDRARALLKAADLYTEISEELASKYSIDEDLPSLEEIVEEMSQVGGPSLTEILDEQRGPKL